MGLGFLLLGFVVTPWQFYLVLGIFIGFGAGAMGQLATSKLVSNWFVMQRGTALGIAATGISVSGVIMPAVSAYIIGEYGWRNGFITYGLITLLVVVPVVLRLVISRPEDIGLLPDGAEEIASLPPAREKLHTREFLRDPNFWYLTLTIGLLFCIQSATLIHMVPRLTDRGMDLMAASFIASSTALFGVFGKLIYGMLVDRWDVRHALWLGIAFQIAGHLFMLFGDNVATPCLDRCGIAGTRRELLLTKLLPAMDCAVEIRPISLAECLSADAVVTTNSVSGVTPMTQLGESKLGSDAGSDWVTALQRAMAEAPA